jgi:DNA-binding MarR family transcriptional regulator
MLDQEASQHTREQLSATAMRLHSVTIHLLRRLRREDDASGLTAPRLSALSVVVFGGPRTLGELATAEQVRPPTMTRIIAALEQAGLVAREPDPADGRAVLIRATPVGKQLLEEGRACRTTALARQLATLAPGELATLQQAVEILDRLLHGRE